MISSQSSWIDPDMLQKMGRVLILERQCEDDHPSFLCAKLESLSTQDYDAKILSFTLRSSGRKAISTVAWLW